MTTQVTQYYADLLIAQYSSKTKAVDTIKLTADKLIDNEVIKAIQDGFNINTAVGNQLDIIGKIVGTSRYITDAAAGGTAIKLSDDEFRFLLKLKIIRNYSNNSFKSMDDSIQKFFESGLIASYGLMNIVYFANTSIFNIAIKGASKDLLPRPMGVNIVGIIKTDVDTSLFGLFDGTNDNDILVGGLYD